MTDEPEEIEDDEENLYPEDIEEAVYHVLARHRVTRHLSELEMWRFAEGVSEQIFPADRPKLLAAPQPDSFYADIIERLIG